jgi:hypothetical protein
MSNNDNSWYNWFFSPPKKINPNDVSPSLDYMDDPYSGIYDIPSHAIDAIDYTGSRVADAIDYTGNLASRAQTALQNHQQKIRAINDRNRDIRRPGAVYDSPMGPDNYTPSYSSETSTRPDNYIPAYSSETSTRPDNYIPAYSSETSTRPNLKPFGYDTSPVNSGPSSFVPPTQAVYRNPMGPDTKPFGYDLNAERVSGRGDTSPVNSGPSSFVPPDTPKIEQPEFDGYRSKGVILDDTGKSVFSGVYDQVKNGLGTISTACQENPKTCGTIIGLGAVASILTTLWIRQKDKELKEINNESDPDKKLVKLEDLKSQEKAVENVIDAVKTKNSLSPEEVDSVAKFLTNETEIVEETVPVEDDDNEEEYVPKKKTRSRVKSKPKTRKSTNKKRIRKSSTKRKSKGNKKSSRRR